jgi:hypothetical protein
VVDEDAGPHTKMMPIEALMKRANAQQRWPLPAVAVEAQVRNAARGGTGKRSFFGRLGDGWRNTSLVTKASLLLMPLLCAVILVRYGSPLLWPKAQRSASAVAAARKAPAAKPGPQPAPAASAASPVSEQAALPASSAPEPTAAGAAAESSANTAPAASGPELAGSAQPPASSAAPIPAPPARGSGSGAVTAQRKAADSVAEGDYARAVERYRSLAKDAPGVPVYREAARILEERAHGARR